MGIDQSVHKFVIIATTKDGQALVLGFSSLSETVHVVECQVTEEAEKMDAVKDALDTGYETGNGTKVQIMDIESYLDIYEESDEDDDV